MDKNVIDIISTLGFPIFCVVVCFWYIYTMNKNHMAELQRLNDSHMEEVKKMTETINNNTLALQKLTDYIMKGE